MKTVTMTGVYDKLDLIIYMSKILTTAGKKVLVIDTTIIQKTRFVIPTIAQTRTYITNFENIDFAGGFTSLSELQDYLGIEDIKSEYDIIFIDIDRRDAIKNFNATESSINLFVTGLDLYTLKRGLSTIYNTNEATKFTRVLFSNNILKEEEEYLDFLSNQYKINWNDTIFTFPLELGDYAVMVENQTTHRIKFKRLSSNYKYSLQYLISYIFEDEISSKEISRIIKSLEKEG